MLIHSLQAIILIATMVQADEVIGTEALATASSTLVIAALLALPVSFCLSRLYRRAVLKSMYVGSDPRPPEYGPPERSTPRDEPTQVAPELSIVDYDSAVVSGAAAENLYLSLLRGPWRTGAIYAVAGACYALVMAAAFLVSAKLEFLPLRFLMLFWIFAWPVALTVVLVAATTWRAKLATVSVYFLVFAILCATAIARSPTLEWGLLATLWLLTNAVMLVFLNQKTRAVRPLAMIAMIGIFTSFDFAFLAIGNDEGVIRTIANLGVAVGLNALGIFIVLTILGFILFGAVAMLGIRWIVRRYVRKEVSDQIISLDALWLWFAIAQGLTLMFAGTAWMLSGVLAFVVYKVVSRAGFSLLHREAGLAQKSTTLLLLRVFALGKRSERLLDALATHWRHAGSILLIAGPDLAMTTAEPHELWDFLKGKLVRRFIDNSKTLELRISQMDLQPDPDGRFRVNEFFCHDHTWRQVLSRLVDESDAVLMDLRGLSAHSAGAIYEVSELVNVVPLERIVVVVDDTTDEQLLRQTVQRSWQLLRPTSPNRSTTPGRIRLFRFTRSRSGDIRQLLHVLSSAAKSTTPAAGA